MDLVIDGMMVRPKSKLATLRCCICHPKLCLVSLKDMIWSMFIKLEWLALLDIF